MCRACHDDAALQLECLERLPEYLRSLHLFRDLDDADLHAVAERAESLHLGPNEWLYEQGEAAKRFYVVRQGEMALFRQSADGREAILALVGEDEVFAEELVLFEEPSHDLFARAVKACALVAIDRRQVRELLERTPRLWARLAETLHRRQQMLLDHIERLTLHDATQRVMAYLLDRVGDGTGPQQLRLSVPKAVLAAHLSIQPETLSRILGRLKGCHFLREAEESVVLLDTDGIRAALHCAPCPLRTWGCPGPEATRDQPAAALPA